MKNKLKKYFCMGCFIVFISAIAEVCFADPVTCDNDAACSSLPCGTTCTCNTVACGGTCNYKGAETKCGICKKCDGSGADAAHCINEDNNTDPFGDCTSSTCRTCQGGACGNTTSGTDPENECSVACPADTYDTTDDGLADAIGTETCRFVDYNPSEDRHCAAGGICDVTGCTPSYTTKATCGQCSIINQCIAGGQSCSALTGSQTCASPVSCSGSNYYYQTGTSKTGAEATVPAGNEDCYRAVYNNVTPFCNAGGVCQTPICTVSVFNFQYACGNCRYISNVDGLDLDALPDNCGGINLGACSNYSNTTKCAAATKLCYSRSEAIAAGNIALANCTCDGSSPSIETCDTATDKAYDMQCNGAGSCNNMAGAPACDRSVDNTQTDNDVDGWHIDCSAPFTFSVGAGDCNDNNSRINPGQNGVNEFCDCDFLGADPFIPPPAGPIGGVSAGISELTNCVIDTSYAAGHFVGDCLCIDGIDNDCNGLVDGNDPNCPNPNISWVIQEDFTLNTSQNIGSSPGNLRGVAVVDGATLTIASGVTLNISSILLIGGDWQGAFPGGQIRVNAGGGTVVIQDGARINVNGGVYIVTGGNISINSGSPGGRLGVKEAAGIHIIPATTPLPTQIGTPTSTAAENINPIDGTTQIEFFP